MIDEFKKMSAVFQMLLIGLFTATLGLAVILLVVVAMQPAPSKRVAVAKKVSAKSSTLEKVASKSNGPGLVNKPVPSPGTFSQEIKILAETARLGEWLQLNERNQDQLLAYTAAVLHPADSPDAHAFRVAAYSVWAMESSFKPENKFRKVLDACHEMDEVLAIHFSSRYVERRVD